MLSPGSYHLRVPKSPLKNLRFRQWLLKRCMEEKSYRRAVIEMCRQDIAFFISTFVWQFNPKKKNTAAVGPFILWDFQEAVLLDRPESVRMPEITKGMGVIWCYENDRSLVVQKSREMGISWLMLLVQDWLALFHPYFQSLNISRSADAVDDKSPNSLFWKLRFVHEYLPDWLKGEIKQEKMYLGYDRTKSVITGEASTGRAGVGGRAGVIFVDEFPLIKEDTEVRQRTANTADCRVFNGTHQGVGTEFYNLTQTPEFHKHTIHWSFHPEKKKGLYRYDKDTGRVDIIDKTYPFPPDYKFVMDGKPTGGPYPGLRSPWYDWKAGDIGSSRGVAMELDIDPKGAVEQFFDALMIYGLKVACAPPLWEGDLHYDRDLAKPVALIAREGGPVKLWINPVQDAKGLRPPVGTFAFGCDVSTGSGATPSCVSCGNVDTGQKVLEYRNPHIDAKSLAPLVVSLCRFFVDSDDNPASLAWEIPGPGQTFGKTVIELGFRAVYFRENSHVFKNEVSDIPGWTATPNNILTLLEEYRAALAQRSLSNYSASALDECLNFKYDNRGYVTHTAIDSTDPSGARVNHGDTTIADALMWMMMKRAGASSPIKNKEQPREGPPIGSIAHRRMLRERVADPWASVGLTNYWS